MFDLFKKKDPVCCMKEKKGEGINQENNWFCSEPCLEKYKKQIKNAKRTGHKGGC